MDFDTLKVVVVLIRIFFVLLEVLGVGGSLGASFAKEGDYLVFEGITVLVTGVGRGRGRGGG